MRIINHTRLPEEYLKAIIKLLTKGITRRFERIVFSYTMKHEFKGSCKHWFSMVIEVAIAKQESGLYPFHMNQRRNVHFNFPKYDVESEEEAVFCVLAHEIYHARANIHHWKNTEKRAEAFAFKQLQKIRGEMEEDF
jgi:hypothetical protein